MSDVRDLLIEIGTEELPPAALKTLSESFESGILKGLADLGFEGLESRRFSTPRRLAVLVAGVPDRQPDRRIERRGPAVSAAFDKQGEPTKAALGFAASCGVDVDALSRLENEKGAWLYYETDEPGQATVDCIPGIVERALAGLPVPKRMRWGAGEAEFVRPVHWAVLLYGKDLIEAGVLGIGSARNTYGHRFHHPGALHLDAAPDYEKTLLKAAYVIPGFEQRRERIREQVLAGAGKLDGVVDLEANAELLDEVTALVEWPVALTCSFEERFLRVPAEALVSTMKDNQKYFPVYDRQGALTRHFIVIANIESREPARVREGNERVIRPRLADAEFFWDQDRRRPLTDFNKRLREVVFQRKLGTLYEKVERVSALAGEIARKLDADPEQAARAGLLCKADLMSEMVFEFPQLQGIMGRYYALESGEPEPVAQAIEEHYRPRFAGDALPEIACGQCVALADKLDTLVGIFAAGGKPTGVRDPFALRRAALGVLKILIEKDLELDLDQLLHAAASRFHDKTGAGEIVQEVFEFILGRLNTEYESAGYTPQQIAAVLACRPTRPVDFDRRIRAVRAFSDTPEAETLAAANKRTGNILKKAGVDEELAVDTALLAEPAEKDLHQAMDALLPEIEPLCRCGDYDRALQRLATLKAPVDRFFDEVLVMAEDEKLRRNRFALLQTLSRAFGQIADISLLNN